MTTVDSSLQDSRVGVIGGSGLYAIDGLESVEEVTLDTPFGVPSDCLRVGQLLTSCLRIVRELFASTGELFTSCS